MYTTLRSSASNSIPNTMPDVSATSPTPAISHAKPGVQIPNQNSLPTLQSSSPPPQNNPHPQNLQPHHNPHNPSPPPTRPRLNHQRRPAPRLRCRRQIIPFGYQRRAKPGLLYHRRRRRISASDDDGSAAVVDCCCGGVRGGRDVLGRRLVGVAAGEGAGAFSAAGGAAAYLGVGG